MELQVLISKTVNIEMQKLIGMYLNRFSLKFLDKISSELCLKLIQSENLVQTAKAQNTGIPSHRDLCVIIRQSLTTVIS